MANIYTVSISLYDTTLPSVGFLPIDYAERHSCKLVYDGGDSKLEGLMASRLEFSLEVDYSDSLQSLFYDYLFSGEENRYLVVLADQDDNELWQGFLLPDDYSEPYTTGTFFVNFTATDNLGTLKGKFLPDSFYRARQSIIKIIADCLKETGMELPIYHAPSIKNDAAGERYDRLFLHGAAWIENEVKADAYTILEDVINSIGCTLWQQEGYWFVVGYNLRGIGNYNKFEYDADGVYVDDGYLKVEKPLYLNWNATPQITLKPPYKHVNITTGINKTESLLPNDIVAQPWIKKDAAQDDFDKDPLSKYWVGTGLEPELTYLAGLPAPAYAGTDIEIRSIVSAFNVYTSPSYAQQMANYISLAAPVYVKGGNGEAINFRLTLTAPWFTIFGIPTLDNDDYIYDVLMDGTTIFSNKQAFTDREAFYLEFEETGYNEFATSIKGSINVENFPLAGSGFLDVRVYHIGGSYTQHAIGIELLEIDYIQVETNKFSKTRNLKRSNKLDKEIFIGDSILDRINNGIVFQPVDILPDYMFIILYQRFDEITIAGNYYDRIYHFNTSNYALFQANIDSLYVKKANSDYYQYLRDVTDIGVVGPYNFVAINLLGEDHLKSGDRIYYRTSYTGDPETAYRHDVRELWEKTTNPTTVQRYGEILAEVIHEAYSAALSTFEGTTKGLVFPNTYTGYEFKNAYRKWVNSRIEMEFGENETRLTAIEYKNDLVEDYIE